MAFSEFYAQTSGSNLNAGSTQTDAAAFTYASGNWVASTGVFTVASGNPSSDGVAVGDFASVFPDGSTLAVFIGRVTARDATTITVSLTAKSGTAPTDGTGNRTLKIGGAWKGPNAAVAFPFGFITNTLTNAAGDYPRVNFKNNATYNITALMTHDKAGPVIFQGYTTTVNDGGRAIIDGGTSGASYDLLNFTAGFATLDSFIFQNNGATGSASGVAFITVGANTCRRCVFNSFRGIGVVSTVGTVYSECETYACNQSNTATLAGFFASTSISLYRRCISHDNAGSNGNGFVISNTYCIYEDCIADSNGGQGLLLTSTSPFADLSNCDFYNNTGDGIRLANTGVGGAGVENCNFVKNGGYGINGSGAGSRTGFVVNCGFGSGTQANTSGTTTSLKAMAETGSITYAADATPWVNPASGDFTVSLPAARNAGRGTFTQTASGYTGTMAYPDIGAGQHLDVGVSGSASTPIAETATFTEHYCNASTGSNMNGGSDEDATPNYAATNGGWDSGTGVFTPASGDPSAVSPTLVGQMASVFNDGATAPVFIGRVTAVSATTVTVSTTAKSGTAPTTNATGRSINVGGVWKGPNAAVSFPFGFITSAQMNASSHRVRVNFKNNTTYVITAAMTHANAGSITFQGYTTTAGDGGRAIIDGGTSGASYVLLTMGAVDLNLTDIIAQNNGASGADLGILWSGGRGQIRRVVVNSVRGHGIHVSAPDGRLVECETYACNQSNSAVNAGITCNTDVTLIRCISHDNTGSNSSGFRIYGVTSSLQDCIADSNGANGYYIDGFGVHSLSGCDAYNNSSNGVNLANGAIATFYLENCNFIKNGAYGINGSSANTRSGSIVNCGFGSGTQANTLGTTTGLDAMILAGSITYASGNIPWVDPANGDFRISLTAAKGTGRGTFTQTASGYTGTVGFPDIGAAETQEAATTTVAGGNMGGGFQN